MTRTSNILCTALFLVTLPGTLLHAQASAGPNRPAGVPEGYVITPFGYFHPSCVLHVAEGETLLADGRILQRADGTLENIPACQYPHYAASGKILAAGATKVESPTINGWVESASVTTSTSYGEIVADWIVPPAPTSNNGQTVFFFPGMEDSNDVVSIIQPVLQYGPSEAGGGNNWAIASWNCCPSGTADYSTLVNVNSGDVIQGTVKSTCSAGTESCSTWNITTADETTGGSTALTNSPSEGQTFNWAFGGVLEAYSIAQCSDYPPNGALFFYNVGLYDYNFNKISSPAWSLTDWASGDTPQCSYGGRVAPTEIAIEYGTPAITSVSPSSLTTQVGSGYVTLLGTGLDNSNGTTSTTISGSGMTWETSYVSASQINVEYTLASNAPLGTRTITVTTSAGSATAPLTITNSAAPPPAINSGGITPSSITQGSSGYVSIYGEDLQNNAGSTTTTISGTGVSWTATYISPTQINVNYTVASNAPTGTRTVTVTTTSGSSTGPITVAP
jgi:hypothetical protein